MSVRRELHDDGAGSREQRRLEALNRPSELRTSGCFRAALSSCFPCERAGEGWLVFQLEQAECDVLVIFRY